jgi:hypothetical protein
MFVLKVIRNPIVFRRIQKLKLVKERCVSYQTIHICSAINTSENYESRNQSLEHFIQHLEKNPQEKYVAINEGIVPILKNIESSSSSENTVIENARLALTLLGYTNKPKSNGIRSKYICSIFILFF